MSTLAPSRRMAGTSLYGLCVLAGCSRRAEQVCTFRIGGADREAGVCSEHAEAHAQVPAGDPST